MLKALRSIFRSYKDQPSPRTLESPLDLRQGDMFRFDEDYSLPVELRGKTFKVDKVATYFYSGPGVPEYAIRGEDGTRLFLSVEDFDGQEEIVVSRKLKRKQVEDFIGWKAMKALTRDGASDTFTVSRPISDWTATEYENRVSGANATYTECDLRGLDSPSSCEALSYYEFYSADEKHSFEIEVWEGNEYEACVGIVRPFSDIAEYWPGA